MAGGETSQSGPVGKGEHVVRQGECISSISMARGFFWKTLWEHPENAGLKQARENPNVLLAGDRVTIPELRRKEESGATEKRHRFRRKGEPARLRLQFRFRGEPRRDQPYRVEIDGGRTIEGQLDGDGQLDVGIPGTAKQARVTVGEGFDAERYVFQLGAVDPEGALAGIQQRLLNLGYGCAQDGELDETTQAALRAFQRDKGLEETGEPDDTTQQALIDTHGS